MLRSAAKLPLEPIQKLQSKPYGQNLCFSRSLQEKDGNAINNVYEPFEEFGLVGSLDSRQKMHQGITDFGPDQRKKHSKGLVPRLSSRSIRASQAESTEETRVCRQHEKAKGHCKPVDSLWPCTELRPCDHNL
ncbi:hypothetical protein M0R45_014533 [Rubus argutus]|uniref:Uncharacterized protein n=1 Tax=Rubus argutus TaxID=59490 RepID=A0AAW1XLP2_RUBAR